MARCCCETSSTESGSRMEPRSTPRDHADLIHNSCAYPVGSVACHLAVTGGTAMIEFTIRDTGPGIAAADLQRLFQPFVQVDSGHTRRHGGSGLGLSIARQLARSMGGDVVVASVVHQGATFCLRLPARPESAGAAAVPAVAQRRPPQLAGRRVLVVDDAADNRLLLGRVLQRCGCEVAFAEDGARAVAAVTGAAATGGTPDLIVMDVQMPVLDGCAATRELRRLGFTKPVVAVTANAMAGQRDECLRSGCDAFLTKPIDVPALYDLLARTLVSEQPSSTS
ncbi:MAG: response regulator [Planctomycetota bacterium]